MENTIFKHNVRVSQVYQDFILFFSSLSVTAFPSLHLSEVVIKMILSEERIILIRHNNITPDSLVCHFAYTFLRMFYESLV